MSCFDVSVDALPTWARVGPLASTLASCPHRLVAHVSCRSTGSSRRGEVRSWNGRKLEWRVPKGKREMMVTWAQGRGTPDVKEPVETWTGAPFTFLVLQYLHEYTIYMTIDFSHERKLRPNFMRGKKRAARGPTGQSARQSSPTKDP